MQPLFLSTLSVLDHAGKAQTILVMLLHPGDDLLLRHGLTEIKPLRHIAAQHLQQLQNFSILNPFRHDALAHVMRHDDGRVHDHGVAFIVGHIQHERFIDLDFSGR